jgi:deoxyribonuclease V
MKIPPPQHRWSVTARQAIAIQKELASRVRVEPPQYPLHVIAGVDAAFSQDGRFCIAGVVVWDRDEERVVETRVARKRLAFPYVPGLLSFREAPAVLAALRRLRSEPDVLICDGHGFAHPRRFGIACHVGVLCGRPALGCAKSRLVGRHREPGRRRGARSRLSDRGETVGTVLRTRDGVKPVYVSVGHLLDLSSAVDVVMGCFAGYRLPEPIRLADRLVATEKRKQA